jgi:para-aminobenzoate synthetase component 1
MSAHLKSYGKSASPAVSWTHFEDFPATDVESLLSKRDYIKRVNDVKSAIIEGEIYQASFTHVFRKKNITDSWLHFCEQFSVNPSNYYVYWNLGGIQICCTSPELFLKLDRGELVARPIKGTLRRVGHHSNELVSSSKNAAELSMIVDLFRNDFNRVCLSGSVEVRSHKEILELQNVFHMFSEIRGLVDPSISTIEIIEAIFPSGSISGCPKIRAFEVLQELEVCRRSFYTGSIGWISKDQINLNVGIRTLFFLKDWIHFHVGGGIVFDSTGEEEYQETLYKAQPFFQSMGNP